MAKKSPRKSGLAKQKAKYRKASTEVLSSSDRQKLQATLQQGLAFHRQNNLIAAEQGYRQALQIDPGNAEAHQYLAVIARSTGHIEAAMNHLQSALARDSAQPKLHFMLAQLMEGTGRFDTAIQHYQYSIELDTRFVEALNNLGVLFKKVHRYRDAVGCFERVLKLNPGSAQVLSNLGNCLKESGQIDTAIDTLEKAVASDPNLLGAHSNLLLALNYLEDKSPEEVAEAHKAWGKASNLGEHVRSRPYDFSRYQEQKGDLQRRIKLGFVSADLHRHSVAFFIEPLLEHLDRKRFELTCYYNNSVTDPVQERLQQASEHWVAVESWNDDALADQIYKDAIDILIDLSGHSAHNRLPVFARRPAPVQMTWLGYPNTTGLAAIDYRISDDIADPPGSSEALCSEEILRVDGGFLCYQGNDELPEPVDTPALKNGYITFGCCNNAVKISPAQVARWSEILKALPTARLLLKAPQFGDLHTREHFLSLFQKQGIDPGRLAFSGLVPDYVDHMRFYETIDIALDTFPYNGTTTTFEGLWMGVPALTLAGDSHASRVGASILTRLGLEKCVAHSSEDLLECALGMSADLDALNQVRRKLRLDLKSLVIGDPERFTRNMESVLKNAWHRYLEKV